MGVGCNARALEEAEPEITEGCFGIGHDEVASVLDTRTTAGDEGGAVFEGVFTTFTAGDRFTITPFSGGIEVFEAKADGSIFWWHWAHWGVSWWAF